MKYDQIEEFSDEQFRRLTGVKRSTFKKMIEILREAGHKKKTWGRKSKLSLENRLLMALEYIRSRVKRLKDKIRGIQWRQWKKPRTRLKKLIALGIKEHTAK